MLSTAECCPLPGFPACDVEDALSSSRTASPMPSASSRTALSCTPTPSKFSSTQRHLQGLLMDELHACKQQLEACKQQLEACKQQLDSANTKAAVAEAAGAAAEAAAAAHKTRAAKLHAQNLQLAAELKAAQRAQAASQRAMAAIRSAIEWAERPLNSKPAGQSSAPGTPLKPPSCS